jgi:transposase
MAMGKREAEEQQDLFVMHDKLPRSPGHVFYDKLNALLREGGFDRNVEALCEPYYAKGQGRPSVPSGVYFRMLLVGYFEGISSQRGIAWRCSDSLSLRKFLGIPLGEDSPDHSSLSHIRNRLPLEVHREDERRHDASLLQSRARRRTGHGADSRRGDLSRQSARFTNARRQRECRAN